MLTNKTYNAASTILFSALVAIALSQKNLFMALAIDMSNCEPIENLGTSNLDRFMHSINLETGTIDADGSCSYELNFEFKHDLTLPIPSDGSQCDPTIVPPAIASDGLPYFAFRWAFESVPESIKHVTGIDHISVDWNPCGHPPVDVFTIPHYDIHIYMSDPEFRSCMTCEKIPGAPVCDPTLGAQSTSNGKGFFNVNSIIGGGVANMPSGFEVGVGDMVPLMGGHAWDMSSQPGPNSPWVDPIWVMGTYDGSISSYEPMIPVDFVVGTEDKYYEQSLSYEGLTMDALPTKVATAYDAASGVVTITTEGKSNSCDMGTSVAPSAAPSKLKSKKQQKKSKKQKK